MNASPPGQGLIAGIRFVPKPVEEMDSATPTGPAPVSQAGTGPVVGPGPVRMIAVITETASMGFASAVRGGEDRTALSRRRLVRTTAPATAPAIMAPVSALRVGRALIVLSKDVRIVAVEMAPVLMVSASASLDGQASTALFRGSLDYPRSIYCGSSAPKSLHLTSRRWAASPARLDLGILTLILPRDDTSRIFHAILN